MKGRGLEFFLEGLVSLVDAVISGGLLDGRLFK